MQALEQIMAQAHLPVADSIELWLLKAPGGPLPYEDERAKEAIKLLSQAWGLGIAHRLAFAPAGASGLVEAAGLPRRAGKPLLSAMDRVGLLEAVGGDAYAPTPWLRRSVAVILRAAEAEYHDRSVDARPIIAR